MPVRSLRSSVLVWPPREEVLAAARRWARATAAAHPEVVRIVAMGSYARGSPEPGSDLDLVLVVRGDPGPTCARSLRYDATRLPVPVDLIVLSEREAARHLEGSGRFGRALRAEGLTLWPPG